MSVRTRWARDRLGTGLSGQRDRLGRGADRARDRLGKGQAGQQKLLGCRTGWVVGQTGQQGMITLKAMPRWTTSTLSPWRPCWNVSEDRLGKGRTGQQKFLGIGTGWAVAQTDWARSP